MPRTTWVIARVTAWRTTNFASIVSMEMNPIVFQIMRLHVGNRHVWHINWMGHTLWNIPIRRDQSENIFFLLKPGWPPLKTGSTCTEIPCELEIRSMGHLYFELVSRLSYPSVSITKFKRVNGLAPGPSNACLAPSLCSPSKKARRMFAGPLVTSEKVSEETLLHNSNAALTACLTWCWDRYHGQFTIW